MLNHTKELYKEAIMISKTVLSVKHIKAGDIDLG